MRLWSLHPMYLDGKGLVALWREGLLALNVLRGRTKGYTHHPQLERFTEQDDPVAAIQCYLTAVYHEAARRGYHFDAHKIDLASRSPRIRVTRGQLVYELQHLKRKLKLRDRAGYRKIGAVHTPKPHPLFFVRAGGIERWERAQ